MKKISYCNPLSRLLKYIHFDSTITAQYFEIQPTLRYGDRGGGARKTLFSILKEWIRPTGPRLAGIFEENVGYISCYRTLFQARSSVFDSTIFFNS